MEEDDLDKWLEREEKAMMEPLPLKKKYQKVDAVLLMKHCFSNGEQLLKTLTQDQIVEKVLQVKRLHLDRLQIRDISNLEIYSQVTHIYLQCNEIEEIPDCFTFMPFIKFLCIFNNKIRKLENLKELDRLEFFDVSNNLITQFKAEDLPFNLRFFNCRANPFCTKQQLPAIKEDLVKTLPKLIQLNNVPISKQDRKQLGGILLEGYDYEIINTSEESTTEETKLQENDEILLESIDLSNNELNYEYAKTVAQKMHQDHEQRVLDELEHLKLEMENKKNQYLEQSKQRRRELTSKLDTKI